MPRMGLRTHITNKYITTIGKGKKLRFWVVPFIVLASFLSIIYMALRAFGHAIASDDPQWAAVGVTMVAGAAYIYRFMHRALLSFAWYRGIFFGWHVNRLLEDGKGDVASSIENSIGELTKKTEILHLSITDQLIRKSESAVKYYVGPSFDNLVDISASLISVNAGTWLKGDLVKISPLGESHTGNIVIDPKGPKASHDGEITFFCRHSDEVELAFGTGTLEEKVLCFDLQPIGRGRMRIVDDDSSDDRMRVIKGLIIWQNDSE